MKAENMDVLKPSLSVLPSENEGLSDSHSGLIKAFNNLDLNDDDQCLLHVKSEEIEKTLCLLPLNCSLESGKDCVVSNGHKSMDEGDLKSKSNMPVHVKNNLVELVEIHKTTSPVKRDESVSNKESSGKMNYLKSEEDLSAFFLDLCLDKKSSCNVKCSATETYSNEVSQDKLSKSLLGEKIPGTMTSCVNGALLKKGENVNSSRQDKHTSGKVLDAKVCGLTSPDVSGVFLLKGEDAVDSVSKKDSANFTSKKLEASSENELPVSDDNGLDCYLVERGSTKKDPNGERKEKKIMSGRAQKAMENASKNLKSFPKLHMSGGLIVDASQCKTLNANSGYLNLVPFNDSSGQCSNLAKSNVQASSLPPFFDPNPINPAIQGSHIDNSYLFPPSCESDNFLDVFSLPNSVLSSSNNNSSISSMEVQNQRTVAFEGQNQKNSSSQHFFDHIEDVLNYRSPVSEMSSYPCHSSRSTSPESGYCSSPRLSPFSDDGSEHCKHKDRQPSISSTSLEICSPPPCVPSGEEFIDNWDMSIFDDIESTSHEIQPTDEESEKIINVIKQDLKKCEELCKANDSDMVKNEHDTLSIPVHTPDSQNSQNLCANVSASLQGCSMETHAPHQQQSSHVNIATQVPSAQANNPQVLVIYVPYAVNGTDKGSKPFKPIEPDPEGQRLLARSPRECLKEKLDRKKQMHYLYRITEKLQSSDKNVIYIENTETRRTNLHLAVIKQDVELAYTILEVHKKCSGDLSMVNCRDIYKKTALQYAIRNVMTVFVEYLKDYGAK